MKILISNILLTEVNSFRKKLNLYPIETIGKEITNVQVIKQYNSKNYRIHEGKNYTQEEWEAYEKKLWEDYKKKGK